MRQYFELDTREKKQEWALLILTIIFFLIIAIGIYFQSHDKNYDNILVPLFFIISSCFFLIYSINAFGKGNLIQKWTPAYIYKILLFFTKKLMRSTDDNARAFVIKFLGIAGLIISIGLFITAIISTTLHL
jgi:uncharacterized membrane protein